MSGQLPASPLQKEIDITSSFDTDINRARSGRRYAARRGAHYWKFVLKYTKHSLAVFQPLFSFCHAQEGQLETFTFISPIVSYSSGDVAGSVPVVKVAAASGSTVDLQGLANLKTVMKAGNVFKFDNHSKVYMLTSDLVADGLGEATLQFKPPLFESVILAEPLVIDAVPFNVSLDTDEWTLRIRGADRHGFQLGLEEVY